MDIERAKRNRGRLNRLEQEHGVTIKNIETIYSVKLLENLVKSLSGHDALEEIQTELEIEIEQMLDETEKEIRQRSILSTTKNGKLHIWREEDV